MIDVLSILVSSLMVTSLKMNKKKKKKELLKELSSGENPLSKQRSFSHWSLCFATL